MEKTVMCLMAIIFIVGCIFIIQPTVNAADEEGNLVIVLDPGHGGGDPRSY